MTVKHEGLPPSYDVAVSDSAGSALATGSNEDGRKQRPTSTTSMDPSKNPHSALPQQFLPIPASSAPSASSPPPPNTGGVTLYHYQNPYTHQTITTHLPPNHPAMQCLQQGTHAPGPTHWGILGLLSAIFCFPIGVVLCFVDRSVVCDRCGEVLHSGISA